MLYRFLYPWFDFCFLSMCEDLFDDGFLPTRQQEENGTGRQREEKKVRRLFDDFSDFSE